MYKLHKLYMYIVKFGSSGFEARSTQIGKLCKLWHRVSNLFIVYGNVRKYINEFLNPGLQSIHVIHNSYITYNTYFVTFVITGVSTFVIPGVNSIYELISYNKFTCIFSNLLHSLLISIQ